MGIGSNSVAAVIYSPQQDVAEQFLATLCGEGARHGKVSLNGIADVVLELPVGLPIEAIAERVKAADFCVMLLRFVDEESLATARLLLRALPAALQSAVHMVIVRLPGEVEFKMSCPKCGQKLLVKDSLAFRRVQCPRCKHPFTIPGQADLIRQEFLVPTTHKISRVLLGDVESCALALANAYRQAGARRAGETKSQTMRIDEILSNGFEEGSPSRSTHG